MKLFALQFRGIYGFQYVSGFTYAVCLSSDEAKQIAEQVSGTLNWEPMDESEPDLDGCFSAFASNEKTFDTGFVDADVNVEEWEIWCYQLGQPLPIGWLNLLENGTQAVET